MPRSTAKRSRGSRSLAGVAVMSALDQAVNDYLALRRGLGFKLEMHGRVLPQFAEFLQQRDATLITTSLALEFATQPTSASVVWWHQRLAIRTAPTSSKPGRYQPPDALLAFLESL